jgi:hypothetical protein
MYESIDKNWDSGDHRNFSFFGGGTGVCTQDFSVAEAGSLPLEPLCELT